MVRFHSIFAVMLCLALGCNVDVDVKVSGKKKNSKATRTIPAGTSILPGRSSSSTGAKTASKSSPSSRPVSSSNTKTGQNKEIQIASFNIQVFGVSKSKKSKVMDVLAKIVRRFDVVAIQEVRSRDTTVIPNFVRRINANGADFAYELGPRLGRSSSKEQYLFVYNRATIELIRGSVYTAKDPGDQMHREPLVARFRTVDVPTGQAFTFTLVNIHTDPDETKQELNALDDVFRRVQKNGTGEDDIIILGDLNVNYKKLGELGRIPNIAWTVQDVMTNTRRNKSYDNIVYDRIATSEYLGRSGVMDIESEYGLTRKEALQVSDHLPVWATFSAIETGPVRVSRSPR